MQADYRLLRVVPPFLAGGFDNLMGRQAGSGLPIPELLETEARTYLKRLGEQLQGKVPAVQMHVVLASSPAVAILDDAQSHNMDLIALATHGRGGLARLFLGSVADKVVRGASVTVLLQRPGDDDGEGAQGHSCGASN
jgi:nucleotide-binding universal stress UspA family protein